jgi:quinol monooxygenase YgiN
MPRFVCLLSGQIKKEAIDDVMRLTKAQVVPLLRAEATCTSFDVLLGVDAAEDDVADGLIYTVWDDRDSCQRFFDSPDVAAAMLPLITYLKTAPSITGYEPMPGI